MAGVETKVRRGCLEAARSALLPLRNAIGASFEAMVDCVWRVHWVKNEGNERPSGCKLPEPRADQWD